MPAHNQKNNTREAVQAEFIRSRNACQIETNNRKQAFNEAKKDFLALQQFWRHEMVINFTKINSNYTLPPFTIPTQNRAVAYKTLAKNNAQLGLITELINCYTKLGQQTILNKGAKTAAIEDAMHIFIAAGPAVIAAMQNIHKHKKQCRALIQVLTSTMNSIQAPSNPQYARKNRRLILSMHKLFSSDWNQTLKPLYRENAKICAKFKAKTLIEKVSDVFETTIGQMIAKPATSPFKDPLVGATTAPIVEVAARNNPSHNILQAQPRIIRTHITEFLDKKDLSVLASTASFFRDVRFYQECRLDHLLIKNLSVAYQVEKLALSFINVHPANLQAIEDELSPALKELVTISTTPTSVSIALPRTEAAAEAIYTSFASTAPFQVGIPNHLILAVRKKDLDNYKKFQTAGRQHVSFLEINSDNHPDEGAQTEIDIYAALKHLAKIKISAADPCYQAYIQMLAEEKTNKQKTNQLKKVLEARYDTFTTIFGLKKPTKTFLDALDNDKLVALNEIYAQLTSLFGSCLSSYKNTCPESFFIRNFIKNTVKKTISRWFSLKAQQELLILLTKYKPLDNEKNLAKLLEQLSCSPRKMRREKAASQQYKALKKEYRAIKKRYLAFEPKLPAPLRLNMNYLDIFKTLYETSFFTVNDRNSSKALATIFKIAGTERNRLVNALINLGEYINNKKPTGATADLILQFYQSSLPLAQHLTKIWENANGETLSNAYMKNFTYSLENALEAIKHPNSAHAQFELAKTIRRMDGDLMYLPNNYPTPQFTAQDATIYRANLMTTALSIETAYKPKTIFGKMSKKLCSFFSMQNDVYFQKFINKLTISNIFIAVALTLLCSMANPPLILGYLLIAANVTTFLGGYALYFARFCNKNYHKKPSNAVNPENKAEPQLKKAAPKLEFKFPTWTKKKTPVKNCSSGFFATNRSIASNDPPSTAAYESKTYGKK